MKTRSGLTGLLVLLAALSQPAPSAAQQAAAAQTARDGRSQLVSKDVGAERWAIALNPADGTATGNVFKSDGTDPQFVWCSIPGDDGTSVDPAKLQLTLDCFGSYRCNQSPCLASAWDPIATVQIAGDFFLPARDPFMTFQRPGDYCEADAALPTDEAGLPTFEIASDYCNYLTVMQPSLRAIRRGDPLYLRLWHFSLTGPANTEAYMGVQIGENFIWGTRIAIPEGTSINNPVPAGLFVNGLNGVPEDLVADFDAPAGTPIYFHFHNHGANNYNMFELNRGGETGLSLVDHEKWTRVSVGVPTSE